MAAALGTILIGALLALPTSGGALAQERPVPQGPLLEQPRRGTAALDALAAAPGDGLATAAARNGLSQGRLASLLREDRSLWLSETGMLHAKDPRPPVLTGSPAVRRGPFPLDQTFLLHSRPGSSVTIFLDFDGGEVAGTGWNSGYGVATSQPGFDLDGLPGSWSDTELDFVQDVFQRVAEDYAPFDVDVTTQDPGVDRLARTTAGDPTYGTRVLITPSAEAHQKICNAACGGVAYVGTFDLVSNTAYQPAWVFAFAAWSTPKFVAEAAAHEAGHNLGLLHDGAGAEAYYAGHGSWAPIMGVGYYEPVTQWSSGEYPGANNTQDDLAVVQTHGLALRPDDHGSTRAGATALGAAPSASGVISTRTDVDLFAVSRTCAVSTSVGVAPAAAGANLDVRLRLLDADGAQLASVDPASGTLSADVASGLGASLTRTLAAGTYYVEVDGAGARDAATGYSDYGSLGAYTLTVSGCSVGAPAVPTRPVSTHTSGVTASFTWGAPPSDGGSPVTGYVVSRDGGTTTPDAGWSTTLGPDARAQSFGALVPGSTYVFSVRALNARGASAAATSTLTMPRATAPGAPTAVTATAQDGAVVLRWAAPAATGSTPISSYRIRRFDGGSSTVAATRTAAASARQVTVTGLTNGASYTFDVAAVNAAGPGPTAVAAAVTPGALPGAPGIGTATPGVAGGAITATAAWTPPASTGGSAVTGYVVRALRMSSTGAVLATTTSVQRPATARTLTMTLPVAGSYRFTVQAVTAVGAGAQSVRSNLVAGR